MDHGKAHVRVVFSMKWWMMVMKDSRNQQLSARDERFSSPKEDHYLGIIMSRPQPPSHLHCTILINPDVELRVGTFVEIPAGTSMLFGKVVEVSAHDSHYSEPELVQDLLERNLWVVDRLRGAHQKYRMADIQLLRTIRGDAVYPPDIAPEPGDRAYEASEQTIAIIFGGHVNWKITIGNIYQTTHAFWLNALRVMTEHAMIVGNTGSGKSNATMVVLEEILNLGFCVVVFDVHGEYTNLRANDFPLHHLVPQNVLEQRQEESITTPTSSRGASDEKEKVFALSIRFDHLDPEQLSEMAGISEVGEDLVHLTYQHLSLRKRSPQKDDNSTGSSKFSRDASVRWSPDEFREALEEVAKHWKFQGNTRTATLRRLAQLEHMGLFGEGIHWPDIVKPGTLVVIDLSNSMRERLRRAIVGHVVAELFQACQRARVYRPILLVVEEAHRFASRAHHFSTRQIRRVSREGRKFGLGLLIVSQMMRNLDSVISAQCATKIILRMHNKNDLSALTMSADYLDAHSIKLIPYLATGTAFVSSPDVPIPTLVEIRKTRSFELKSIEELRQG